MPNSPSPTVETTAAPFVPPLVPASYFGLVLGLAGIGYTWRAAHQVWGLPDIVGEALMAVATMAWAGLLALYILKWIFARPQALAELDHPVQCCFIGLIGVTTMLIAGAALPYSREAAEILCAAGVIFTIAFMIWRTGGLWQGGRDPAMTTPVLYLPAGAGSFVTAITLSALGHPDWAQYAFGMGLFSALAIESVLLHRLYTVPLPPALRPTLGVQLAPSVVGALAYLSITSGPPDMVAHAMVGYGLLQAAILLRLTRWIREQPFAPSYWAFTFGATALATASIRMVGRADEGLIAVLAPYLFGGANILVGLIALGTCKQLATGTFFPKPAPSA